jgi:hypothetical protein
VFPSCLVASHVAGVCRMSLSVVWSGADGRGRVLHSQLDWGLPGAAGSSSARPHRLIPGVVHGPTTEIRASWNVCPLGRGDKGLRLEGGCGRADLLSRVKPAPPATVDQGRPTPCLRKVRHRPRAGRRAKPTRPHRISGGTAHSLGNCGPAKREGNGGATAAGGETQEHVLAGWAGRQANRTDQARSVLAATTRPAKIVDRFVGAPGFGSLGVGRARLQNQGWAGAPLIRNGTVTMLDATPRSLRSSASMRPSLFRSVTTFGASLKMPS